MKNLKAIIGGVCLFMIPFFSAAQQKEILRKELLNTAIKQHVSKTEMQEITLSAGQEVPKHLHPCPVVGFIKSGKVIFQIEGQEKVMLNEGDGFYEPKGKNILHFDNASKENPLIFIVVYLKKGSEENIKLVK